MNDENALKHLDAIVGMAGTLKTDSRFKEFLEGLQKAIKFGDIAIQHNPEVTALVWAGGRLILEVRNRRSMP